MVVQGHLLTSETLSKTLNKLGGCQGQGQGLGRAVLTQLCRFRLLSSLTPVSGSCESIFISGLLPADCDSSVNVLCKLNLTSTVFFRANFFFYRCFLLQGWQIDAATFSKYKQTGVEAALKSISAWSKVLELTELPLVGVGSGLASEP